MNSCLNFNCSIFLSASYTIYICKYSSKFVEPAPFLAEVGAVKEQMIPVPDPASADQIQPFCAIN